MYDQYMDELREKRAANLPKFTKLVWNYDTHVRKACHKWTSIELEMYSVDEFREKRAANFAFGPPPGSSRVFVVLGYVHYKMHCGITSG